VAQEWAEQHLSKEQLSSWGPMDTSTNPLSDYARQLSTPGHTLRPVLSLNDATTDAGDLINEGGVLDQSNVWANLQHVHYMVLGVGDWVLVPEIEGGQLGWRHVSPSDCYALTDPKQPSVWRGIAELMLRDWINPKTGSVEPIYTWTVYDLRNPANPSMAVYKAEANKQPYEGEDLSGLYMTRPLLDDGVPVFDDDGMPVVAAGRLDGEDYPYRYADGAPFFPHVRYTAWATGDAWNAWVLRGAYRGALNSILYRSFSGRAALDAVGTMIVTVGVKPPIDTHDVGRPGGTNRIPVTPGMWAACEADGDTQPVLWTVGPGQNLEMLDNYAGQYEGRLASRFGLNTGETIRQSGNSWSAAALFVTDADKRQESQRSEPSFRASDKEMIRKSAAMLRLAGVGVYPETGYSITYQHPPEAPEMQRVQREEVEWKEARGLSSPIDTMITLNPGMSREAAANEIVRASVESAALERDVAAALASDVLASQGGAATTGTGEGKAQDTALNGAQVTAAQGIVESVAAGQLPRQTGVAMLVTFFNLDPAVADAVMGTVGASFTAPEPVDTTNT